MSGPRIKAYDVRIFETPLKRPFVTSLGRKTTTTNVGLNLTLSDGASGYGEASASLALSHLSPKALACALDGLARRALGRETDAPGEIVAEAWKRQAQASPAAAAFECALLEAWSESRGLSLSRWLGGALERAESDLTLSAWDPAATAEAAREAAAEGFRVLKVKVGGDFEASMARLRAARRACPRARFLLDGNQGMSESGALRLIEACLREKFPVDLLEQPLEKSAWRGMARLTRRCPVAVAADEMVSTPREALRAACEGAARALNIKVAKSGILRSLEIAAVARAAGLGLMIGCMAETARGLSASVHLALGTGFFRYVDLDSDHLLAAPGPRSRPEAERPDRLLDGRWRSGWRRRGPILSLR